MDILLIFHLFMVRDGIQKKYKFQIIRLKIVFFVSIMLETVSDFILGGYKITALNMPANLENSAVATGLVKGQFSFQSQRKAMPKKAQTTAQLHSSHTLVK